MAVSAADIQAYFEDIDWASFNDLRIDDATIEQDLAIVANQRLHAAFDAAQTHYLHGAPEGASASTPNSRRYNASATHYQVNNYSGASYMGYSTRQDAEDAWNHACANKVVSRPSTHPSTSRNLPLPPTLTAAPTTVRSGLSPGRSTVDSTPWSPLMPLSPSYPLTLTSSPLIALSPTHSRPSTIFNPVPLSTSLASSPNHPVPGAGDEPAELGELSRSSAAAASTPRNSVDVLAATSNAYGKSRSPADALNTAHSVPPNPEWQAHQDLRTPVATTSALLRNIPQPRLLTGGLADEDIWWVVIEGLEPGVYQGQ
ncbi:hypothetical protein HYPSUDRAFT_202539 [Hypholoma sublateritium FD-334 SS-4]|uniref:Uncharacterized protein n=1 Tax=Hypholoma sublateritium (strain FD-334 SS-4) TaxID=945553 RepID=A0A0D2NT65_HYPSF|nr:hypothetical protein HYPSUDRAFT_202539 [Hypholoma sublateritium FD-334 SS-4]